MEKSGIKVKGYRGKWYVVETLVKYGKPFYLLEHETYGEDCSWVAINERGELVLEYICEGVSELAEYLEENPLAAS